MAICDNCGTEIGTSYRIISDYVGGKRPQRRRYCNEVCHVIKEKITYGPVVAGMDPPEVSRAWHTVWKDLFMRRR